MRKQRYIVAILVLVNLITGRIFQESLDIVCFSELLIVNAVSLLFWNASLPWLKKGVQKWNETQGKYFIHSGFAISTTLLNVLFTQALVIWSMVHLYHCTSPSFSFINASMTNNIAINFLCYGFLAYTFSEDVRKENSNGSNSLTRLPVSQLSPAILVTMGHQKIRVLLENITHIEASKNCIVIHTADQKYVKYQSLKSFLAEIEYASIKRVHRSYAVHLDYVKSIEKNRNGDGIIHLTTETMVRFSRTYSHELNA